MKNSNLKSHISYLIDHISGLKGEKYRYTDLIFEIWDLRSEMGRGPQS